MSKEIDGVPIKEFITICVVALVLATSPLWAFLIFAR